MRYKTIFALIAFILLGGWTIACFGYDQTGAVHVLLAFGILALLFALCKTWGQLLLSIGVITLLLAALQLQRNAEINVAVIVLIVAALASFVSGICGAKANKVIIE